MSAAAGIERTSPPVGEAKPEPAKLVMVPPPKKRLSPTLQKFVEVVLPPLLGILLFIGVWALIAQTSGGRLPGPLKTWLSAVEVFSHPFYVKGPNDQGIGWNILSSLQRVGFGFGLAAVIGIPIGFLIGRGAFFKPIFLPFISLLLPGYPPASLPFPIFGFKTAQS